MNRFHRLMQGFAFAAAFGFLLLLVCGGLLLINPPIGIPGDFLVLLIYGWVIYAFIQYREGRQQEVTHLLCTAAESQAPLAPALWAYLDDRPRGTLREFWTGTMMFFLLPGYYWIWHRRHSFEKKVARVAQHLEMGEALPDALEASPGVVSPGTILATRIGEVTGRLADSLRSSLPRRLTALWLEMLPRFLYPLVLLLFMAVLTAFWMTNIFPRLERIYAEFEMPLPRATERLIDLVDFVVDRAALLFLAIANVVVLAALFLASTSVRWHFPLLGRLYRRHQQGNVLRLMSALLRVDMPAPEAIDFLVASDFFQGTVQRRLVECGRRLREGGPLAQSLESEGLLPSSMVGLVQAAQRMGNLPWALDELSETLAQRTARTLVRISQVCAPLLVMAVGSVVALEVIGMFMPVIDIIERLAI